MTDLKALLHKARSTVEEEEQVEERKKLEKENEEYASFMADFDLLWEKRESPLVTLSGRTLSVCWRSTATIEEPKARSFSKSNTNYFSRTAGLTLVMQGSSAIVLEVPGRDSSSGSDGKYWGEYSDLADLKATMLPQALRKMLPKFPSTHRLFSEAYMALDAYFRTAGEAFIQSLEDHILELEQRQASLQERYDNLPPPMEALAAVPVGRRRKKAEQEAS